MWSVTARHGQRMEGNWCWEVAFGNVTQGRQAATNGMQLVPTSHAVSLEAALAYAKVGDTERAESMAEDLSKRLPLDTQVQSLWLPGFMLR